MRVVSQTVPECKHSKNGVRRYPRTLFSVPISVHYPAAGGVRCSRGVSLDISEGGLGALVESGLHVGERVRIDLPLGMTALSTVAIVRYSSRQRSGFEFVGLTPEARVKIADAGNPLVQGVRSS